VGHAYAQKRAKEGNDITYVQYPEPPHGFIQMTALKALHGGHTSTGSPARRGFEEACHQERESLIGVGNQEIS
jgi:hypothetical protein